MKNSGYLLITLGFLVGAYFAVVDTEAVSWRYVVPALLVGLVGIALVQLASHGKRRSGDAVRSSVDLLGSSLSRIVDKAARLDSEKETIDVYDVRHRIDDLFMSDLDTFVDNRESIGHAYGLQSYADVMTQFATGERYLNRCWSASTDGYVDEVHTFLTRSHEHFAEALRKLEELERSAGR
ncbi:MAG: hypothetical protein P8Y44_08745 [Acidobacteriota bacterium]